MKQAKLNIEVGHVEKILDSMWKTYDKDADGILTLEETKKFTNDLLVKMKIDIKGLEYFNPFMEQLSRDQADQDREITKQEFLKMLCELLGVKTKEQISPKKKNKRALSGDNRTPNASFVSNEGSFIK